MLQVTYAIPVSGEGTMLPELKGQEYSVGETISFWFAPTGKLHHALVLTNLETGPVVKFLTL